MRGRGDRHLREQLLGDHPWIYGRPFVFAMASFCAAMMLPIAAMQAIEAGEWLLLSLVAAATVLALAVAVGIARLHTRWRVACVVSIAAGLTGVLLCTGMLLDIVRAPETRSGVRTWQGRVVEVKQRGYESIAILDTVTADGVALPGTVRMALPKTMESSLSYGMVVSVRAPLRKLLWHEILRHGGGTAVTREGVRYESAEVESIAVTHHQEHAAEALLIRMREALGESIERVAHGRGDMLRAMIVGDKASLPSRINGLFRETGLTHLLVVSGLHVSFVAAMMLFALQRLRMGQKWLFPLLAIGMFVYTALTDFAPPVLRSALMLLIYQAAAIGARPADRPTVFALVFLGLCFAQPMWYFDVGAQLSFSSVAGILLLTEPLEKALDALPRFLGKSLAATIGAQLGILPFLSVYIGNVSVVALLANVVAVPIYAVMVIVGLLAALLSLVFAPLGQLVGLVPAALADLLMWWMEVMSGMPVALVNIPAMPGLLLLAYTVLILLLSRYVMAPKRVKMGASVALSAMVVWLILT